MRAPRCRPCITTMSRFFSSAFVLKGVNALLLWTQRSLGRVLPSSVPGSSGPLQDPRSLEKSSGRLSSTVPEGGL